MVNDNHKRLTNLPFDAEAGADALLRRIRTAGRTYARDRAEGRDCPTAAMREYVGHALDELDRLRALLVAAGETAAAMDGGAHA